MGGNLEDAFVVGDTKDVESPAVLILLLLTVLLLLPVVLLEKEMLPRASLFSGRLSEGPLLLER